VRLEAYGLRLALPQGWSGRVFSRGANVATVHAGDFPLSLADGEFGDTSTGRMPAAAVFMALTEYRPGRGLEPGRGLFAAHRIPLPLDPAAFSARGLQHHRPGQAGLQHFATLAGRPFCLYVVLAGSRRERGRRLPVLDGILRSLSVDPR
jgi:hypothetical protein